MRALILIDALHSGTDIPLPLLVPASYTACFDRFALAGSTMSVIPDGYPMVWFSADGINLSAPWRLDRYGPEGPLSDEQVADLAGRFDLDPAELRRLSSSLGYALDKGQPHLMPIHPKAAARAQERLHKAARDVRVAQARLLGALRLVAPLDVNAGPDHERLQRAYDAMVSCVRQLEDVPELLNQTPAVPGSVVVMEKADKRHVKDKRRTDVLMSVFRTWHGAGRPLSCTTDSGTSERRGPLIDFANAVVACVTDPPSTLSGETIFKDLMARRHWIRDDGSVSDDLSEVDQDT